MPATKSVMLVSELMQRIGMVSTSIAGLLIMLNASRFTATSAIGVPLKFDPVGQLAIIFDLK